MKYDVLRGDDKSIYGKREQAGASAAKTGEAVVVGIHDENIQPGQATYAVERLGEYLTELGF